jgi:hypothetical protein
VVQSLYLYAAIASPCQDSAADQRFVSCNLWKSGSDPENAFLPPETERTIGIAAIRGQTSVWGWAQGAIYRLVRRRRQRPQSFQVFLVRGGNFQTLLTRETPAEIAAERKSLRRILESAVSQSDEVESD